MSKRDEVLDARMLSLSETDHVTMRDLAEGTLITGAPGSGKTTTSGKQLAYALLKTPNSGGLILTAKAEETANWIAYAKACGREKDLIVFNSESGLSFDPLHYEWTRPGRGAGDLESIIDFFSTLVSIGHKNESHGNEAFWERGNEQLMRNCIKLLDIAGEPISITSINEVVKSLPTRPNQHEEADFQAKSYCASLIRDIKSRQDNLTKRQWSDLDACSQYAFEKWPAFDERPRSSLEMIWAGMADKFQFYPFKQHFSDGFCSFTPEDTTHRNKLVISDWPMLEFGHETGRTINVMLKLIFQRAWLRRKISESPNPVFLWQDEFQYFITRRDNFFQQTCRGSRVAVVCLTQNILNLSEELGEDQPGSKTKSFLGNLGIKIFHQQNETETCNYAADQIGKHFVYMDNYNAGGSGNQVHAGVGGHKQLVHIVEPLEFTRLIKPDAANPLAQAIVYKSGTPFNATKTQANPKGRNFLPVFFSREA